MAAPKKPSPKKPTRKNPSAEPEGRRKSKLRQHGDEAKQAAERALLLKTLKANDWNLTHTAEALEMSGPSSVIIAIGDLGLGEEYEAAKNSGRVAPGRPAET